MKCKESDKKIKIIILVDGKFVELTLKTLKAEWGFSALVVIQDEVILFDAGHLDAAFHNLQVLNLPKPKKIVLSHGHYDHTGGLLPFLNSEVTLYAHPDVFLPRFYKDKYIGIPYRKEKIEGEIKKLVEHKEPIEIAKNVWALGEIPRPYETSTIKGCWIIKNGKKMEDNILDDQALAIKTEKGGILILGCCHSGLRNTIKWAQEVIGQEIKFIIGGTHLIGLSFEKIKEIIDSIEFEFIAPCHCTGLEAEWYLKSLLKERFKMIGVGSVLEF